MRKIKLILVLTLILAAFTGCGGQNNNNLMLHLEFNEEKGVVCNDSAKKQSPAKVQYVLSNGTFQDPVEPGWRTNGILKGALQFDGYSTFVKYEYEDFNASGKSLSIDVWVAPRAYEWLDYNGDKITAFVSQHNKRDNEGFILGFTRDGTCTFQVGLGDRWIEVWDKNPIEKYEWSHIVATFNGDTGEVMLYKNGELVSAQLCYTGAVIKPAIDEPLLIGKNNEADTIGPFSKEMFSGLMDELKIYSNVLSEKDVQKSFQKGLSENTIKACDFDDIWFDTEVLVNDINKPLYHISAPQHWMNEPHAPMYYNGKYHLFYQFNPFGPYWQQIHWGHWVSDDMINWVNVKEALSPAAGSVAPDGIWSGGVAIKNDGTPVLLFTAGDDNRVLNSISNQNIGLATPDDLTDLFLTDWTMYESLAVKQEAGQGRAGEFRDPHIWKEDDIWYMLIASGSTIYNTGAVLCYTTTDDSFTNWEYRGSVYDWDAPMPTFGTSWELPIILPIQYENGTASGKYIFSISPAPAGSANNEVFYWIGGFDKQTCRFTPDFVEPKRIDFGKNVFTGPSAFIDPDSGDIVMFSIIQDQRLGNDQYLSGWAHGAGLPRVLTLDYSNNLLVNPVSAIEDYVGETLLSLKNVDMIEANRQLSSIKGDVLRIKAAVQIDDAKKMGILVRKSEDGSEQTQFFIDMQNNRLGVNTGLSSMNQNVKGIFDGEYTYEGNVLEFEIYLDRSVIEGFFGGKNTVTARVYPTLADALGIELYTDGGNIQILNLTVNEMRSIYE